MTQRKHPAEDLLATSKSPIEYDVERGLTRHRALVEARTELPAWGQGLREKPRVGRARYPRWLIGAVFIIGTWWISARENEPGVSVEIARPAAEAPSAAAGEASSGSRRESAKAISPKRAPLPSEQTSAPTMMPSLPARALGEPTSGPALAASTNAVESAHTHGPRGRAGATPPPAAASAAKSGRPRDALPSQPLASTQRARGASSADTQAPDDQLEMRALAEAERALASNPAESLRLAREGARRFPRGYFGQERRYVEVMALVKLGRMAEARAHAWAFLQDYPTGPYRKRVEQAVESQQ